MKYLSMHRKFIYKKKPYNIKIVVFISLSELSTASYGLCHCLLLYKSQYTTFCELQINKKLYNLFPYKILIETKSTNFT